MSRLLLISAGGALGTAARFLLSTWMLGALGPAFPYGTLAVNLIGSFLLGAIMQAGLQTALLSPTARLVLGTGVMGGFTTYSSFNHETLQLAHQGRLGLACANLAVTVVGCLLAGAAGLAAGHVVASLK